MSDNKPGLLLAFLVFWGGEAYTQHELIAMSTDNRVLGRDSRYKCN